MADARRLAARARERGAVLLVVAHIWRAHGRPALHGHRRAVVRSRARSRAPDSRGESRSAQRDGAARRVCARHRSGCRARRHGVGVRRARCVRGGDAVRPPAGRPHARRADVRTLVLCCPDWSVVAAGAEPEQPFAVVHANRVVAASPAARCEAVELGLRRREAQARCPGLVVVAADPARDARAFEPVAIALDALTPRIELTRPGRLAFATRGPSRYFGGDRRARPSGSLHLQPRRSAAEPTSPARRSSASPTRRSPPSSRR